MKKEKKTYNYEHINSGYYDIVYKKKGGIQKGWHVLKFNFVKKQINQKAVHLDVGCGPGTFIGMLKSKICKGLDISKKQINFAKKTYQTLNKKFYLIKNNKFPFKSNYFDSISIIELIEHLDRQSINKIISESFRVLKKNGLIIITTPNYNSLWPMLEMLVNKFLKVNYEEQHITKLNRKKLNKLISKRKFKIIKVNSFMHIAPFIAFFSYKLSMFFSKFDLFWNYLFPGFLLYLIAKKK